VLVPDIELVKKEQELPFTPIPSLLRLNVVDRCNDIFAGSRYFSSTEGFKFVGVIEEWGTSSPGSPF
jgi:hypothetical protein